jgi:hypothetical protein
VEEGKEERTKTQTSHVGHVILTRQSIARRARRPFLCSYKGFLSMIVANLLSLGRFLVLHFADDILFGNTFDRPLKLPLGTGLGRVRF